MLIARFGVRSISDLNGSVPDWHEPLGQVVVTAPGSTGTRSTDTMAATAQTASGARPQLTPAGPAAQQSVPNPAVPVTPAKAGALGGPLSCMRPCSLPAQMLRMPNDSMAIVASERFIPI